MWRKRPAPAAGAATGGSGTSAVRAASAAATAGALRRRLARFIPATVQPGLRNLSHPPARGVTR
jgi:hypothetical protein